MPDDIFAQLGDLLKALGPAGQSFLNAGLLLGGIVGGVLVYMRSLQGKTKPGKGDEPKAELVMGNGPVSFTDMLPVKELAKNVGEMVVEQRAAAAALAASTAASKETAAALKAISESIGEYMEDARETARFKELIRLEQKERAEEQAPRPVPRKPPSNRPR